MTQLSNAAQRDIETLIHPYTDLAAHREAGPVIIERGRGVKVWDSAGKEYIEGLAGLWCTSLGYGNEELAEAAKKQIETLSFAHIFGGKAHDPAIELAEKIKALAPMPVSKIFFTCSGSEANDSQIKLIWYYNNARGKPDKKKIISRQKAYHGVTIASASLTGLPVNHADFDLPIDRFVHTDCPHFYRFAENSEDDAAFVARLAANLTDLIEREGADTIAAFIAEPIMGAGGVLVPPAGYFEAIAPILKANDILFIDDEVICGFGRTGNFWGAETFNFTPDTMSIAKALSSGYAPIGAVMIPEEIYQAMLDQAQKLGPFGHGFTYSGHPLCAAIANTTLDIYQRIDIVGMVRKTAPLFQDKLAKLAEHPLVGETRGEGLIGGVELVADKDTRRAFDPIGKIGALANVQAQTHGLLMRNIGDTLALCPPLIISADEIADLFERLENALDATEALVSKQGLRQA